MHQQRLFRSKYIWLLFLTAIVAVSALYLNPRAHHGRVPEKYGLGRTATEAEIQALDIDVRVDGIGLPVGRGTVEAGRVLYLAKCQMCHGDGSKSEVKLPGEPLFLHYEAAGKVKTIGNYWPYATTIFDYVRRAMPYNAPGSLSDQEVYDVTAYLLFENKLIRADQEINEKTLPKIVMPAKKLFVSDTHKH